MRRSDGIILGQDHKIVIVVVALQTREHICLSLRLFIQDLYVVIELQQVLLLISEQLLDGSLVAALLRLDAAPQHVAAFALRILLLLLLSPVVLGLDRLQVSLDLVLVPQHAGDLGSGQETLEVLLNGDDGFVEHLSHLELVRDSRELVGL